MPSFQFTGPGLRIVCKFTLGNSGRLQAKVPSGTRTPHVSVVCVRKLCLSQNRRRAGRTASVLSVIPRSAASGCLDGRGKKEVDQAAGGGRALWVLGHGAGC